MKKNTKILIVIAVALMLAALAAFLIVRALNPTRTTVYLFNQSYSAGTTVSGNMFTPVQVDSNMIILGNKTSVNTKFVTQAEYAQIVKSGDSLKIDVSEGMPLMRSMLSVAGGNAIEMMMKPSAIAVTVSVNNVRGVTNELTAGSHVNVYFTSGSETRLLFENMRVLNVEMNSSGIITAVSLETNHAQAVTLVNAAESGNIYLGLVNANGYQYLSKSSTDSGSSTEYDLTPSGN